jgi:hypothetical protein
MFGENGSLPVTGSVFLAVLLYALVSLFVTGPLVGERMIARMDWPAQCAAHIRAGVEAGQSPVSTMPRVGCNEMFGFLFGAEGMQFCARHGESFENNPINRALDAAETAKREAQQKRLDYAASRAGSQCECAVTTTLENRRVPLAIHAGSARLVTPPSIKLLESDLITSLNGPACAPKG